MSSALPPRANSLGLRAHVADARRPLEAILRTTARASVAVTLGAAAGCSSAFDAPGFEAPCDVAPWSPPLAAITLAAPHDYLAAVEPTMVGPRTSAEVGERCADAPDPPACGRALDEELVRSSRRRVVSTDDGVVCVFPESDGIARLVGPVDVAEDALLVVWGAGYDIVCGSPSRGAVRQVAGGYEVIAARLTSDCAPIRIERFALFVRTDGTIEILAREEVARIEGCVGRRPAGLLPATPVALDVGGYLASIARLEASAVLAFDRLDAELRMLEAPSEILEAVRVARCDEVRHAAVMRALAEARGGVLEAPVVARLPLRGALEVAVENAVEGTVRETYGAIVGMHQAACATDPEIATAMASIAEDEISHALLSWRIAAWLEPRLSADERAMVFDERARAFATLASEVGSTQGLDAVERALGLPAPHVARSIVRDLTAALAS